VTFSSITLKDLNYMSRYISAALGVGKINTSKGLHHFLVYLEDDLCMFQSNANLKPEQPVQFFTNPTLHEKVRLGIVLKKWYCKN
jgi:hypothetical protein